MAIVEEVRPHLNDLRELQKSGRTPAERQRAAIVLARSRGLSQRATAKALGCVRSTVQTAEAAFRRDGLDGVRDGRVGCPRIDRRDEVVAFLPRLVAGQPEDFGWSRSTWTIELIGREVLAQLGVRVSVSQLARLLHAAGCRRIRPKQRIALTPADKAERMAELQAELSGLLPEDTLFYEDEVDIHLNPKIGPDWAPPGVRKEAVTPGQNRKHYVAGAYDPATRRLVTVDGTSKCSALFIALVDRLVSEQDESGGTGRIHIVLDNYIIHRSKKTQAAVARHGGRVVLHFLPPYSPDENPIERVWLDLHSAVTRNHRCAGIDALMDNVRDYLTIYDGHGGRVASLAMVA